MKAINEISIRLSTDTGDASNLFGRDKSSGHQILLAGGKGLCFVLRKIVRSIQWLRQAGLAMPVENVRTKTITSKPLTPTLSSNLRTRPAHGVTPRLAAATVTSPSTSSSLQRNLRQQTLSPERNAEDVVASLNANITPRSGARISRFDVESPSTPDTVARTRTSEASTSEDSQGANYGLGISSPVHTPTQSRSKPNEHFSYLPMASNRRISGGSNASSVKEDSKFFRADDVKSPNVRPTLTRPKTMYSMSTLSPRISPNKASSGDKDKSTKFYHASSISETQRERQNRSTLATKLSAASTASEVTLSIAEPAIISASESDGHSATPRTSLSDPEPPQVTVSVTDLSPPTAYDNGRIKNKRELAFLVAVEVEGSSAGFILERSWAELEKMDAQLFKAVPLAGSAALKRALLPSTLYRTSEQISKELEAYLKYILTEAQYAQSEPVLTFFQKERVESGKPLDIWMLGRGATKGLARTGGMATKGIGQISSALQGSLGLPSLPLPGLSGPRRKPSSSSISSEVIESDSRESAATPEEPGDMVNGSISADRSIEPSPPSQDSGPIPATVEERAAVEASKPAVAKPPTHLSPQEFEQIVASSLAGP